MNRKEFVAQQMNRAFQLMADGLNLTESQAMEIADLYEGWAAGKAYTTGKILKYGMNADGETQLYTVLQDHTSQENWTPDTANSLYKKVGFTDSGVLFGHSPLALPMPTTPGTRFPTTGRNGLPPLMGMCGNPVCMGWKPCKGP